VTLEEKIVKDLKISKGKIFITVGKKEILSIMLRRALPAIQTRNPNIPLRSRGYEGDDRNPEQSE
jgi:hypothetical protein